MKFCYFLAFVLLCPLLSKAQSPEPTKYQLKPCGTAAEPIKDYEPHSFGGAREDTILYIPLTLHVTGDDNGNSRFPLRSLFDAVCRLNADYEGAKMQFFWEGEIDYIDSSYLHNHDHVNVGGQMMLNHNVPNTVNSYFCASPAGNCGYNLPWAFGTAMSKSCSGPNDHTWAHEIGHFMKLPHPFYGWESIDYSVGNPAPLTNTQDAYTFFQDTAVWDTSASIIATYNVEKWDSTNCQTAGDHFCDTRPDYLSYRWPCGADNYSTVTQIDPNGVSFKSDGSLFMSYAYDECQSRFSDEQIGRMRNMLNTMYSGMLYNQTPGELVSATLSEVSYPAQDDTLSSNGTNFSWTAVPGATHYIVEWSRLQSFSAAVTEMLVADNQLYVPNLDDDKKYYIRVRAINRYDGCTTFGPTRTFYASSSVSGLNTPISKRDLTVWPNPSSTNVHIAWTYTGTAGTTLLVHNAVGQLMCKVNISAGVSSHELEVAQWPNGLYNFQLMQENKVSTQTFIKQ